MLSCKSRNPFAVCELQMEDFLSTEDIEKVISNRKKYIEVEKINWLSTREIKLKKKVFHLFEEDFQEVNIQITKRGKPPLTNFASKLKIMYPEAKTIYPRRSWQI